MKKKFFAVLVSIAIILSTMPFAFSASAQDKLVKGNTLYDIKTDDRTDEVPEGFGKADGSSNGRVWTDKSVYLNGENFEVKLSALAQEYVATNVDISMSTIGVDVVMILDMSGSMRNNKLELEEYDGSTDKNATRTKAMVKALNEAIETIMVANPNNRVTIYTFQNSSPVSVNLIPLEHYKNESWTDAQVWKNTGTNTGSGKYLNYSVSNSNDVVTTNANLKNSAGATLKQTSCSSGSGTPTQFGIQTGIQGLISQLNAKSYDYERVPFVLLFTDGIPGTASKTAANAFSNTPQKTGLLSHQNNGSNEITAYTILTAAYQKDQLEAAYSNYNQRHKGDSAYEVHWYNIGLGVDNTDDAAQGHAFLDPSTVLDGSNSHANNSGSTKGIKSYIASAATGNNAKYADNYVYVEGENFIYFANTSSALTRAFNNLANDIKEASQEVGNPVTTVTSEGQSATRELVFTDVIGDNLLL
ncbi:MAG: VWA domain-containing protein, partial [Ruminococcus sp.]|nr:VWA domain-containing protein [Ruminococcus sp.]